MPLFQNESSCKAFHMKMSLISLLEKEPSAGSRFLMNALQEESFLNEDKRQFGNGLIYNDRFSMTMKNLQNV